jgi:putative tricarboxylic transport membrane protein
MSNSRGAVRARLLVALSVLSLLLVSACGGGEPEGGASGGGPLAGERVRLIVPTSAGGGFDTTARQIQPYLEEELDATLVVENLEGGGYAIGTQAAINDGGCTLLFHAVPHLAFSYLTQNVDYTLDDLAPVAGISIEPGVFRVRDDAPWATLAALVADARSRPNEIRLSVSELTTSNFVAVQQLQRATGVDFNVIPYDGGGPARTALISGEVDITHAGVFNSLAIDEGTRVLAISQPENRWPGVTDDAPTANGALGVDLPPNASTYGLFVPQACKAESPQTYQAIVDGVAAAVRNEELLATLDQLGEKDKINYLPPEGYGQLARQSAQEITDILAENPDAFATTS